ncbi:hypothetical protein AAFF_G00092140 [Aldrovandia affinis]|uniref:Uncharacterized protein n=1 Tax=Aldrovandia affinis TaxID=143900 RepID=A0AAD7WY43_9TELE|nr:hypothetical protein AAFF_G00092140 [Aldrovandia affinis]
MLREQPLSRQAAAPNYVKRRQGREAGPGAAALPLRSTRSARYPRQLRSWLPPLGVRLCLHVSSLPWLHQAKGL